MLFKKKHSEAEIIPDKEKVEKCLRHIAFIMDGNGRWAKEHGMPRKKGHKYGADNLRRVCDHCKDIGIKTVTVYAFSTENWQRPKDEVDSIMKLLCDFCDKAERELDDNKVRFVFIGDKSVFPDEMKNKLSTLEKDSEKYEYTLNIALNYGSRAELVHAANLAFEKKGAKIEEKDICENLYTSNSPDPDLIVRTGGDYRISNFLLWQAAYAELCFTKTYWPDLNEKEIDRIVCDFLSRDRRYGGVKDEK